MRSTVMRRHMSVCLSVCPLGYLENYTTTGPNFTKFSVHVDSCRGLVLLWRRCDKLNVLPVLMLLIYLSVRGAPVYVIYVITFRMNAHTTGSMQQEIYSAGYCGMK